MRGACGSAAERDYRDGGLISPGFEPIQKGASPNPNWRFVKISTGGAF